MATVLHFPTEEERRIRMTQDKFIAAFVGALVYFALRPIVTRVTGIAV